MKKFLAVLLSVLMVVTVFAVPVSALTWKDNQTVGDNGNYTFDNAYGFVFEIDAINTAVVPEGTIICTTTEAYNSASLGWCNSVVLDKVGDNVYSVNRTIFVPQASVNTSDDNAANDTWQDVANVNLTNGQIVLAPHSSYSNPNGANWEAKLAANALKVGDKITLADIDVAAGTLGANPTATVQDDPADAEEPGVANVTVVPAYNFKYAAGATVLVPWTMGATLESILDKQYEWFNFAVLAWNAEAYVYEVTDVKIGTDIKATADPENGVDFGVLEIPENGFILGAHSDAVDAHNAIASLKVGDVVYVYGTDLDNATIETALTDAVVTTVIDESRVVFVPGATEEPTPEPGDSLLLSSGLPVMNAENISSDVSTLWIDTDLTDGIIETADFSANIKWTPGQWFGYWYNPDSAITPNAPDGVAIPTIDLGKEYNITSARINMYIGENWSGVVPAKNAKLLLSNDGIEFTEVDYVEITPVEGTSAIGWVEVAPEVATSARYVRIAMELSGYWMFVDEMEVYGYEGATDEPTPDPVPDPEPTPDPEPVPSVTIGFDRVNNYDWTNKDFESDAYTPTAASAGEILLAVANDGRTVADLIGGNWFTWWYKVRAELNQNGEYVIVEIDVPGSTVYEAWTAVEDQIIFLCNTGYASTEPAGNKDEAEIIKALVVGDRLALNIDISELYGATGAISDVYVEVNPDNGGSGGDIEIIPEEIITDGIIDENGWNEEGWTEVTPENGYWQSIPTTDTISYKYQFRTDDQKLFGAFIIDCVALEGGNGNGTNVRLWFNTNPDATVYTHFYDVHATGTGAKYNTSATSNAGAVIEDSSFYGVMTCDGEKTYVEFSVDLGEFNGENGFNYYVCVSNKINENVCLYYPAVVEGTEGSHTANLPYGNWYRENEGYADVEAIRLGEIIIDGNVPSIEDELKEALGEAPEAPKFDLIIDAPADYKAGDEITVNVTLKSEVPLHVLQYNLWYDNSKLLLTNKLLADEYYALDCVTLPEGWENWTKTANNYYDVAEGEEVVILNDGLIKSTILTSGINEGDAITEITFTYTFIALEDASGEIGLVIAHDTVSGGYNTESGADRYEGNGSYAVISEDTTPSVEDQMKEELGEDNADAKFDVIIDAPETYVPGEEIAVNVTLNSETPLHVLQFIFKYDATKLALLNAIDEETAVDCVVLPEGWENWTIVLEDGVIKVTILTAGVSEAEAIKDITFTFNFIALEDAEDDLGFVVPNDSILGAYNTESGADKYVGNGSYAVLEQIDAPVYMLGDIDGNGEVDMYDYILLKRAVMGTYDLDDVQLLAANVNGDDVVDQYDYMLVKRAVMGTYTIG